MGRVLVRAYHLHQQPEENYLPCFSQLISLERYTLRVYRAGEIDLFENLDIVHIRFLVAVTVSSVPDWPIPLEVYLGLTHPYRGASLTRKRTPLEEPTEGPCLGS